MGRDFKPKGENILLRHDSPASSNGVPVWAGLPGQTSCFFDTKKTHLNGVPEPGEYVYVVVLGNPAGDTCPMNKWLYAACAWVTDYTRRLAKLALVAGESSAVAFHSPESEVRCVVHGDDFTFMGVSDGLQQIRDGTEQEYSVTVRAILGDEPGDDREIVILNRLLGWRENRSEYEADPIHCQRILQGHWTFDGVERSGETSLARSGMKACRWSCARKSPQSPEDLQHVLTACPWTVLTCSRLQKGRMARPTTCCWSILERIARYLVQHPRLVFQFRRTDTAPEGVDVPSDSDWAG